MKQKIFDQISTECPWRDTLYWYDTVDSTNTCAKAMAHSGAPHGTVILAGSQTGGRGRMDRSFSSPAGMGMYLSVILRPNCAPNNLMHLTCAAAVAACNGIEKAFGIRPKIKWINDLVCNKQKLGGILTELSTNSATGLVDYAIIGIGINCRQKKTDFPAELQNIAISLETVTGKLCSPAQLAAATVEALYQTDKILFSRKTQIMETYRQDCMTLGQDIAIIGSEEIYYGKAISLDEDGGLVVAFPDGTEKTVNSGEVSVRGMYGYV